MFSKTTHSRTQANLTPSNRRRRHPWPLMRPRSPRTWCIRHLPLGSRKHTPLLTLDNHSACRRLPQRARLQHRSRRDRFSLRSRRSDKHSLHLGLARPPLLFRRNRRLRACDLHDRRPVAEDHRRQHDRSLPLCASSREAHGGDSIAEQEHHTDSFHLGSPRKLSTAASSLQRFESGDCGAEIFARGRVG